MPEISAVIIIRKGSKRVPNKNYQKIGNEMLYERKIRQLKSCKNIDRVIIGSDDIEVKEVANALGAEFYLRNDTFCDEKSTTVNQVVSNMLSFFHTDIVVWAHCTNPFINTQHYDEACDLFKTQKEYDSLFSVNELEGHFWRDINIPINFSPLNPIHIVARDLPKIYAQNGGIFIRDFSAMKKDGAFIGQHPFMYKMNKLEGLDIDYPIDLTLARYINEQGTINDYNTV